MANTPSNIEELAEYALKFFKTTQRGEETIWVLKDRHPTWIYDMVYAVHDKGQWMPDDYKYEYVADTLHALSEGQDPEEGVFEIEPDVYTSALQKWLTSHAYRSTYVDDAVRALGYPEEGGLDRALMMGQVAEKEEVWRRVVQALEDRLEAIELGEAETWRKRGSKKGWSPGG